MKVLALACSFNKEMALVGTFSGHCETLRMFVDSSPVTTHAALYLVRCAQSDSAKSATSRDSVKSSLGA